MAVFSRQLTIRSEAKGRNCSGEKDWESFTCGYMGMNEVAQGE